MDNFVIVILISYENISCDNPLEPSRRDIRLGKLFLNHTWTYNEIVLTQVMSYLVMVRLGKLFLNYTWAYHKTVLIIPGTSLPETLKMY